jgi:hypothetical protein
MPTMEEYAKQPIVDRLKRCEHTADELAAAIQDRTEAVLARRPDATNWAAKEVVCHLRDAEEFFGAILKTVPVQDNPTFPFRDADKMAAERHYLSADAAQAVAEFRRRRQETLRLTRALTPEQWKRGFSVGGHAMTLGALVALMAWHDDNHLDQLKRALEGQA